MKYKKIDNYDLSKFIEFVGNDYVLFDKETLLKYSSDETEDLQFLPELVLKPRNSQEISNILKYCNKKKIPITPCGARTGLSGGSLPLMSGLVMSMERFNKILDIDQRNLQATVEPGVINEVFQSEVEKKGLFYPPDPASKGSCTLGGNLAENAGGPKALKYGVTKDYVLNLEIVTPEGDIIWTGANVLKNATGYNLTQLIIGSEGTLGIITKIVFKLIPLVSKDITMLASFVNSEDACKAVSAIFIHGITPSAIEFMERDAIDWAIQYSDISIDIDKDISAQLLIEVDGNDLKSLYIDCEKISEVLEKFSCKNILIADSASEKDNLWRLRRLIAESVKSHSVYKEEDTVVPRAELPKLLNGVKKIGSKYGFQSVCYGHAGDGNLHVNIIKGEMKDDFWNNEIPKAIREIFELTRKLNGTISGEHGIGLVQKDYLDIVFSRKSLDIQKGIKNLFDPNNILNPGKIFN